MNQSYAYYLKQLYKVCLLLVIIYIVIFLAWLWYLAKRLIVSNKLLRRNTYYGSNADNEYSIYNARTQVIMNKFLIALVVVETLITVLLLLTLAVFRKHGKVWNTGSQFVNNSILIPNGTSDTCMVDYQLIALSKYPFFFLVPALSGIAFLLLISLLSIHTYILDMRYRFFEYKRGVRTFAISFVVQSLILIATCFTRYTVLFEPLLFFIFLGYDFISYVKLFKNFKLTLRGRILELYTTRDCARSFNNEQRELKRYIIFTIIFCFAMLIPSIQFHVNLCFVLFSYNPSCVLKMFFLTSPNLVFIPFNKMSDQVVVLLNHLNPVFIMVPCFFMFLPHLSYVVYYLYCKVQKRRRQFRVYNTAITEKFV